MSKLDDFIKDLELKRDKIFKDQDELGLYRNKNVYPKDRQRQLNDIKRTQEIQNRLRFYKNLKEALTKNDIYDKKNRKR